MAIKFNCPKCKKEMLVKDELAGKQGKCPGCQSVLTVPAASPVTTAPVKKKPVEEEMVAAEVMGDDEEVAEVMDDEDDAPKKKKKRRDDDDEDEDDRPSKAKKKSSRRDDDDDDDDDDDRPSKKKKASARRDDDDDDDDEPKKQSPRQRRAGFERAALGIKLNFFGHFLYAGVFGLAVISAFILAAMSSGKGGGGGGGFLKVLSYLTVLPLVAAMVLNVVGSAFIIKTPGKNGEFGLAIASVSTAGVSVLLAVVLIVQFLGDLFGAYTAWMIPFLTLNPCSALGGGGSSGGGMAALGTGAIVILLPLVEVGRLTCLALFQWAVGKSQRDKQTKSSGFLMVIVAPSVCFGMGLFLYLLGLIVKSTSIWVSTIFLLLYGLVIGGMLVWYALTLSTTQGTLESAR